MSFEDHLIRAIDQKRERRSELSPTMKKAHERAKSEVFSNTEYVIQEQEFRGVYDDARIEADVALANRLEAKFAERNSETEKNAKKIAEVLEAIILMQSEMSNWLGNAHTLKTSRYDDYTNKVDMIAEWFSTKEGSRLLALAVDVTFGASAIENKLAEIKQEIDSGKLGSIRYFRDVRGDFAGTRNNVPRVVLGVSQEVVNELAGLWMRNDQQALGKHSVQALMCESIAGQLSTMRDYARKHGKEDVAFAYDQALVTMQPLREEKAAFRDARLNKDPVAEEVRMETRRQFS